MFGRQRHRVGHDEEIAVDAALELDLGAVEASIEAYLENPSARLRDEVLAALEVLDQQIDQSDAYGSSIVGSGAFGYSTKGSVIGETSSASATEEIPGAELRAQSALIKAAKQEVSAPSPVTLTELRAAHQALAEVRGQESPAE